MRVFRHSLSAARNLVAMLAFCTLADVAQAAAILSLSGNAQDAKYESDSQVRLSVIDWSAPEQLEAVEAAYRQYQSDGDLDAFLAIVEEQDSRGYLFTAAATGYRIKYAWKEDTAGGQLMHFLVTPGLKTRNPYLWNTPNETSQAWSFVQVELNDETGVLKTSLDGELVVNEYGKLQLDGFDNLPQFATVRDSTPYYLK